jgi:hypothetical protein
MLSTCSGPACPGTPVSSFPLSMFATFFVVASSPPADSFWLSSDKKAYQPKSQKIHIDARAMKEKTCGDYDFEMECHNLIFLLRWVSHP